PLRMKSRRALLAAACILTATRMSGMGAGHNSRRGADTQPIAAPAGPTTKSLPPFDSPALSPADSAKLIHVRSGYEVELVASEPLLESPVAIDWDEQGRLWVVEMVD